MLASQWIGLVLFGLGYAIALSFGSLGIATLPTFVLLLASLWLVCRGKQAWLRGLGHGLFVLLAFALALHWLPGFNNAKVIAATRLTPDAVPFSLHLNLDKPLIGLWLLLACPWLFLAGTRKRLASAAVLLPLTCLVTLGLAVWMGMIEWAPKWPAQAWIWLFNNLLLVSLTEELLFRGYLQGSLQRALKHLPQGQNIALLVAAGLFGLAHFGAGWQWVSLATLAGIGYGLAYRYGGLYAAIACHFGLNMAHFTLFTYPQLMPQ
ncbi:CPBP family intramembrane glutamic endopeptidase [Pseudomonas fontis]|uniref:CPBP family intramembrane metalloprotease n=1 Tax=Pseudomonas fontis TaxID=2942633 RepID=A0ABT5NVX8_9PSED|nr:type II CAAX endopeptidase family protein [Pseudomonas fontis]MDD0976850.1 CPBP family intramembrane metalloprotease [Pseudomonas fontis]MDD0992340.1 CPBP family intramembrane metalloprotease [Pseudomonas fontis]